MKKNILYILLAGTLLFNSSCDSLLDVDPQQSIDSETALTSENAVNAAVNAVYSRFRELGLYGRDLLAIPELLADDAINTGAGNRLVPQANNQPAAHMLTATWQMSYYAINQINLVFEALETLPATDEYKANIAGQLHFLRALSYHTLAKCYAYDPTAIIEESNRGGVPIITKGVLTLDHIAYNTRPSIGEVYDFIYADLENAITKLPNNTSVYGASKSAAHALFSRVALYRGDMTKVISEGDAAIATGGKTLAPTNAFVQTWRTVNNPESFFEVAFTNTADNIGVNESLRATYTTRLTPTATSGSNHGNVVLNDAFYALYGANDVRREIILRGLTTANRTRWEITKFISRSGVNNMDNVPVIRLPEVILNMAEAYATANSPVYNEASARTQLNLIRNRAGIGASTATGAALFEDIIMQRRLELAFEGHRFFDLKRLGSDIIKPTGNVAFTDFRILANIPVREAAPNTQVVQNPGY